MLGQQLGKFRMVPHIGSLSSASWSRQTTFKIQNDTTYNFYLFRLEGLGCRRHTFASRKRVPQLAPQTLQAGTRATLPFEAHDPVESMTPALHILQNSPNTEHNQAKHGSARRSLVREWSQTRTPPCLFIPEPDNLFPKPKSRKPKNPKH